MDTSKLKKFAQFARRTLIAQVSAKLDAVLAEGAAARREHPEAMKKLEAAIARDGKGQVIERVAYIWFNRFSALRFMDVNDLNPVRVVSPLVGQFQPEILAEAKAGNIDEDRVPEMVRSQVRALLEGRTPSPDAQAEAYRLLVVAVCNDWHKVMPFLFERIDDFTELLLPQDLLSNTSILAYMREAMTPEVCEDVEVIGWLYQFYISEKKDVVFAGLKNNKKIAPEDIPAATQLFTPHWIVRYLVENSLGRLWMLNRPDSGLKQRMDFYILPEKPEADFLRISSPEEIKICDPACGSGHMLTYAFDLLHAIYEEEGYDAAEIPEKILTHNLFGIEIDERAGALAGFALVMKAAGRRKRFLRRAAKDGVQPNICVLENVSFKDGELADYTKAVGRDLFTADLRETLGQFADAKNFGSLIVPMLKDVAEVQRLIAAKDFEGDMLYGDVHARVQTALRMTNYLSPKYHVVVANPPYLGRGGMNPRLMKWSEEHYADAKSDLFAMFMARALDLTVQSGLMAMINMQSWMFLSSFERLRASILSQASIVSMAHLGERAFDTIGGSVVSTTAFVLLHQRNTSVRGDFIRLVEGRSEAEKVSALQSAIHAKGRLRFRASIDDFERIPSAPIAYWISPAEAEAFKDQKLGSFGDTRRGLQTGNKDRFIRNWYEPSYGDAEWVARDRDSSLASNKVWFRFNNGGDYRKWAGGFDLVVNWKGNGAEIKRTGKAIIPSEERYFQEAVCWGRISSGPEAYRYHPAGVLPGDLSPCFFSETPYFALAYLNTPVSRAFKSIVNPTITNTVGDLAKIPAPMKAISHRKQVENIVSILMVRHQSDWDAYETSWDFTTPGLFEPEHRGETLSQTYTRLRAHWRGMTEELQRLEEENNRIFIDAYGLQDELAPKVPLEEITLICNPAYRYGDKKTEAELEDLLRADTMREFLSYAVGCMFGRYSLNAPGLILANQGDGLAEYLAKVPNPTFEPDADDVIPVLDGDWFADDIAARFRKFLRVTFGNEQFQENLAFIEEALGKDIRKYFTRDFFNDHVKRYKKRPIYWLFSSPRGTFNALIYMHRYRPDTVSVVLNDYLREFRSKLVAHRRAQEALSISGDASPAQKTQALKEIEATAKQIDELDAWERDVLFPLATQKIEIDLDDGVKANYPKFGAALKPIKGLNDADD